MSVYTISRRGPTSVKVPFPLGSTNMGFIDSMRSAWPLAWWSQTRNNTKCVLTFFFPPNIFAALYSLYLKWLVIIMCYSKGQLILQKFSAHLYRQLEVFMTTMDQLTGKRSHRVDSPSNIPASYPSPGTKGKTPAGHEEPLDSNLLSVTNTLLYKRASCVCARFAL